MCKKQPMYHVVDPGISLTPWGHHVFKGIGVAASAIGVCLMLGSNDLLFTLRAIGLLIAGYWLYRLND